MRDRQRGWKSTIAATALMVLLVSPPLAAGHTKTFKTKVDLGGNLGPLSAHIDSKSKSCTRKRKVILKLGGGGAVARAKSDKSGEALLGGGVGVAQRDGGFLLSVKRRKIEKGPHRHLCTRAIKAFETSVRVSMAGYQMQSDRSTTGHVRRNDGGTTSLPEDAPAPCLATLDTQGNVYGFVGPLESEWFYPPLVPSGKNWFYFVPPAGYDVLLLNCAPGTYSFLLRHAFFNPDGSAEEVQSATVTRGRTAHVTFQNYSQPPP